MRPSPLCLEKSRFLFIFGPASVILHESVKDFFLSPQGLTRPEAFGV